MKKKNQYPDILIVLLANAPIVKSKWIEDCIKIITKNKEIAQKEQTHYGKFILGGGETNTHLYKGELSNIQVIKTPNIKAYYTSLL